MKAPCADCASGAFGESGGGYAADSHHNVGNAAKGRPLSGESPHGQLPTKGPQTFSVTPLPKPV